MKEQIKHRALVTYEVFGAVMIVLTFALIAWGFLSTDTRDPIVGELRTEALNSPVRPGEFLDVKITREKVRDDCPVISVRKFVDEDGRVYDAAPGVSEGGSDDVREIVFRYPVPPTLPPGSYELRVSLTYVCSYGSFDHVQEPTRFRVIE